jgi:phenylalanine-4-hydroxylase
MALSWIQTIRDSQILFTELEERSLLT